jgi:aerobic-type carbon monoxide dehydrogenase small subunit (CoxS/CutS family)
VNEVFASPYGTDHSSVNRTAHTVEVDPDTPLLYVLNDELVLRGPRFAAA